MNKNTNIANISTSFNGVIYRWINFTHPFHNLSTQEQNMLAELLIEYFYFKKSISDENSIWKIVFDYDTKLKIKERLGIEDPSLQNLLTRLRKKEIIKNNKIIKKFIPNIENDADNFKIIYNFSIKK